MSDLSVGIDVGGSKTRALVADENGIVDDILVGSANPASVGIREARRQLRRIFEQIGSGRVAAVCVGAAGIETSEGKERYHDLVTEQAPDARITIVHDTALILAAASKRSGIALIAGTGSVAWGKNSSGQIARSGGWGYLLGDEGSGYWMGRSAVQHALARIDAGLSPDRLTQELVSACGLEHQNQLIDHFYANNEPHYWAGHARIVFALADQNIASCKRIVESGAEALVEKVRKVRAAIGLSAPVVLAGGLIVHQPLLQDELRTRLQADGASEVTVLTREPAHGALQLTKSMPASPVTFIGPREM